MSKAKRWGIIAFFKAWWKLVRTKAPDRDDMENSVW
jgi:hypothetical protein